MHSVVSSDFAISIVPGWHETVFPPYFVAGAIFSGFAMVLLLCHRPSAMFYRLEDFITIDHLDVMGKILLATSLLTSYGYFSEQFMAWYGGDAAGSLRLPQPPDRLGANMPGLPGPSSAATSIAPQILWLKSMRRNQVVLFIVSFLVLIGMWLERYMIILTSLHRDFLPSSWGMFQPTIWDYLTYVGSIGVFLVAVPAVHPAAADDLDVGDAGPAAGSARA